MAEVADSLVVHLEDPSGGNGELLLFVVLAADVEDSDGLRARIASALRTTLTPRHAPDTIEFVPTVPRTRTGKKLEVPIKRILQGADAAELASLASLDDQHILDPYVAVAARRVDLGQVMADPRLAQVRALLATDRQRSSTASRRCRRLGF
jgi:acetoacetyl-CoA synthetase